MNVRCLAALIAATLTIGCQGDVGTIALAVKTAPGSMVMDAVQTARLTLSDPFRVIEAQREPGGQLILDLEVVASGNNGFVRFDGFDADGNLVALGFTPPLPIAAIDADLSIYVAPPGSIAEAPVEMDPPRTAMGTTTLAFGSVYAGGRTADGQASTELTIYNTYDHSFQVGEPLPAARVSPSVTSASAGQVFIFGGLDDAGDPSSNLWRFDTNIAPAGAYFGLASKAEFARAGATTALIGPDLFLVTGDPVLELNGISGGLDAYGPAADWSFEGATATTILYSGVLHTLVAGANVASSGAVLIIDGTASELDGPAELARQGHATVVLATGDMLVLGGTNMAGEPLASGVRFNALTRVFAVVPDLLATPRVGAAVASSGLFVIVAGGADALGELVSSVEVFDGDTLEPVSTLELQVPRRDASALPLPNGQIIIAGGTDAAGEPVATVELFTPSL